MQTCGERLDLSLLLPRRGLEVLSLLRRSGLEVLPLLRHRGLQLSNGYFLFLDGAMLLEKLIEQHRIHGFIADRVRFALFVAGHQVRIDLLDLFGDEAKLRDAFRIKVLLVPEGDWLQRENRFARFIHRLDCFLVARRRGARAQVTTAIDDHSNTARHRYATNASNVGVSLRSSSADANGE